jgi:hypothetical protein
MQVWLEASYREGAEREHTPESRDEKGKVGVTDLRQGFFFCSKHHTKTNKFMACLWLVMDPNNYLTHRGMPKLSLWRVSH